MVVVAIIGIIAAIAYPGYQGYIKDTYRAQAVADLKVCALALDRYYSNGFTYQNANTNNICTLVSPSDATGSAIKYNISYQSLTDTNYIIGRHRWVKPVADSALNSLLTEPRLRSEQRVLRPEKRAEMRIFTDFRPFVG